MFRRFHFLNPFPMVDGDLELVAPMAHHVDALLATLRHPLTEQIDPESARTSRGQILEFLRNAPAGQQPGDAANERVPAYHFWMLRADPYARSQVVGGITLRVGHTHDIERYIGHVGYHVYPLFRGHRLAERAARLVIPLARAHDLRELCITCNPDNLASRRTIERLSGQLVETVTLPPNHPLRQRGEETKCRFRVTLDRIRG